jgi:hypothetical protein
VILEQACEGTMAVWLATAVPQAAAACQQLCKMADVGSPENDEKAENLHRTPEKQQRSQ